MKKQVSLEDLIVGNVYSSRVDSESFFPSNKDQGSWKLLKIEETDTCSLLTVRFVDKQWTATIASAGDGWKRIFFVVGYES